jgi:hypothetical protein
MNNSGFCKKNNAGGHLVKRLKQRLQTAYKALGTPKELLAEKQSAVIVKDADIQRFEYSFEVLWETGRHFLRSYEGIETKSHKGTIRGFFQICFFSQ